MTFIMLPVHDDTIPVMPVEDYRYTTLAPCMLHRTHVPETHLNEVHHVWPKGLGGPNIPENRIVVCATGHNNIHKLMDLYLKTDGQLTYSDIRIYSFKERSYARLGWERSIRKFM